MDTSIQVIPIDRATCQDTCQAADNTKKIGSHQAKGITEPPAQIAAKGYEDEKAEFFHALILR